MTPCRIPLFLGHGYSLSEREMHRCRLFLRRISNKKRKENKKNTEGEGSQLPRNISSPTRKGRSVDQELRFGKSASYRSPGK
jgi:hypothetical protein